MKTWSVHYCSHSDDRSVKTQNFYNKRTAEEFARTVKTNGCDFTWITRRSSRTKAIRFWRYMVQTYRGKFFTTAQARQALRTLRIRGGYVIHRNLLRARAIPGPVRGTWIIDRPDTTKGPNSYGLGNTPRDAYRGKLYYGAKKPTEEPMRY